MNCLICPDRAWCEGMDDCPYFKAKRPALIRLVSVLLAVSALTAYSAPHTQGGYSVAEGWRERLIDLDALYGAVGKAESNNGRTSLNHYQLTEGYVRDVESITGLPVPHSVYEDKARQEAAMLEYWNHYGERYEAASGRAISAEVLAKMHRVGYRGLKSKPKTARDYWHKVRPEYEARKAHNQFKRKGGR